MEELRKNVQCPPGDTYLKLRGGWSYRWRLRTIWSKFKIPWVPTKSTRKKGRKAGEEPGEWWSLRGRTYQEGIRSHPWLSEGRSIALCYALCVPRATSILLWLLWLPWGSWSSLGKLPGVEGGANKWKVCITNFLKYLVWKPCLGNLMFQQFPWISADSSVTSGCSLTIPKIFYNFTILRLMCSASLGGEVDHQMSH